MKTFFTVKEGKMIITADAFKAQKGIGNHVVHVFDLPLEKEYKFNRSLLKLLFRAYETDSVVDRNLLLSSFIIHIHGFKNKKFTTYITNLWLESVRSLASCMFAKKQTYQDEIECEIPKPKKLKKFKRS